MTDSTLTDPEVDRLVDGVIERVLNRAQCPREPVSDEDLCTVFEVCCQRLLLDNQGKGLLEFAPLYTDSLKELMKVCRREASYARLRTHEAFQRSIQNRRSINMDIEAAEKAWEYPYEESLSLKAMSVWFSDVAHQCKDAKMTRHGVFIQSTGTGKSRTMDELAKTTFTLPFNLRPREDTTGFPLGQAEVRDFLHVRPTDRTKTELQIRYLSFFTNLFQSVARELTYHQIAVPIDPLQNAHKHQASRWRDHLREGDHRSRIYSDAVKHAVTQNAAGDLRSSRMAAQHAANNLLSLLGSNTKREPFRLVMYFDECGILNTEEVRIDDHVQVKTTAYKVLCDALNAFDELDIFTIFLSTNSNMYDFSPQKMLESSGGPNPSGPDELRLQPFFTEASFDLHHADRKEIVAEGKHSLMELCGHEIMARFGRPLWKSAWKARSKDGEDLIQFAMNKLAGHPDGALSIASENTYLACLMIRLLLEFEPIRQPTRGMHLQKNQRESELVSSHMRIIFSIPEHAEYMRTGAPSEPILAEAAARLMVKTDQIASPVLNFIQPLLKEYIVAKGERGELIARLLLTLAHDSAVEELVMTGDLPANPEMTSTRMSREDLEILKARRILNYSQPIPVCAFLKALVSDDKHNLVLTCGASQDANILLQDEFKDAYVHFTHFARPADDCIVDDEGAWLGMTRGLAWQCYASQEAIDIIIPVAFGDPNTTRLDRFAMSAILIQVKNTEKRMNGFIQADRLRFFTTVPGPESFSSGDTDSRATAAKRPYIALVLNLGVQNTTSKVKKEQSSKATPISKKPRIRSDKTSISTIKVGPSATRTQEEREGKKAPSMHPRFYINIVGCSPSVYKVIRVSERPIYGALLTHDGVIESHPRQHPDCRDAVMALKPVFERRSFSWNKPSVTPSICDGSLDHEVQDEGVILDGSDDYDD